MRHKIGNQSQHQRHQHWLLLRSRRWLHAWQCATWYKTMFVTQAINSMYVLLLGSLCRSACLKIARVLLECFWQVNVFCCHCWLYPGRDYGTETRPGMYTIYGCDRVSFGSVAYMDASKPVCSCLALVSRVGVSF